MSDCSGENSGLLDNLRKSVKEQVGSKCYSRELMSLDILIVFVRTMFVPKYPNCIHVCEFTAFHIRKFERK